MQINRQQQKRGENLGKPTNLLIFAILCLRLCSTIVVRVPKKPRVELSARKLAPLTLKLHGRQGATESWREDGRRVETEGELVRLERQAESDRRIKVETVTNKSKIGKKEALNSAAKEDSKEQRMEAPYVETIEQKSATEEWTRRSRNKVCERTTTAVTLEIEGQACVREVTIEVLKSETPALERAYLERVPAYKKRDAKKKTAGRDYKKGEEDAAWREALRREITTKPKTANNL